MRRLERTITLDFPHRVFFTRGAFDSGNKLLPNLLGSHIGKRAFSKILVVIDDGLMAGTPDLPGKVETFFDSLPDTLRLVARPQVITGGEPCKNDWKHVEQVWSLINEHKICRHSYVFAVGGGAFLDMVGLAASTAHRGIRMVRFPTTTLSQGDGGLGVKNGVNYFGKKNWVGSFTVPFAVVNDFDFLDTLPERQRRQGIIEAIKVALIRDASFYCYMEDNAEELARLEKPVLEEVIRRSGELHLNHIASSGDPFEFGSARPLDFGHWAAHKLEQVSNFELGHGEAVAIGLAIDVIYSRKIGMLKQSTCDRILGLIQRAGFAIYSEHLRTLTDDGELVILEGLEEFREHLGGQLTVTLIQGIGKGVEVNEMRRDYIIEAMDELRERADWRAGVS